MKPADLDLGPVLQRSVRVRLNGVEKSMQPFEAQFEQCAAAALNGDIAAGIRFINWCLREGLIAPVQPRDDFQDRLKVPLDWDQEEFLAYFHHYGFPPWPGERDGLTAAARETRKLEARTRRLIR